MNTRALLLPVSLLFALAFVAASFPAETDASVYRANRLRWLTLDDTARDELRARSDRFERLPEAQRKRYGDRLELLRRVERDLRRRLGVEPDEAALAEELSRTRAAVREAVRRVPTEDGTERESDTSLLAGMEVLTRRRIEAFLDSMVSHERLTRAERDRIAARPFDELVDEGLTRLAAEALFLYSEGGRVEVADELAADEPRDALQRLQQRRRERGFLGAAGRYLPLSAEEREEIEGLPLHRMWERLKELKEPEIRRLLADRNLTPAQIDALLDQPDHELERRLDALLADR